ncbi:phage/plasmid primase, P4 family [Bradyrhizobium sp. JYMT SZCCT0428]|uniref:DNA primase family protein n=1 Tax=Bradyrhizobium sp. JYMT SZCCT0428 TaxID=2807673 RepID=UPI001BAE4F3B|nr:phage/plasmid primase, P4 family [Bradyrhizobium sp. JYMT SZCCT0428]MBR1156300.1 hypothetical protein [Bradyrhizobium sp. JYMT SZCCT0428]
MSGRDVSDERRDENTPASTANRHAECVEFLHCLRPNDPWILTAIVPDGPTTTSSFTAIQRIWEFIAKHDGQRNLYYSVNPVHHSTSRKAKKQDILAAEYILADLDPIDDETPEQAKKRYLVAIDNSGKPPTMTVDTGNGLQVLWRLQSPVQPENFDDVESRTLAQILRLGGTRGTQNVDRIFRLPGTMNLPTRAKIRRGRVRCQSRLISVNRDAAYPLSSFPRNINTVGTVSLRDASKFRSHASEKATNHDEHDEVTRTIRDGGRNPDGSFRHGESRSENAWYVACAMVRAGRTDEEILAALLDADNGISEHILEQGDPDSYARRQIEKAKKAVSENPLLDPSDPMRSARTMFGANYLHSSGTATLVRHRGAFLSWTGSHYQILDNEAKRGRIWRFLELALKMDKNGDVSPFKPKMDHVSNVFDSLCAICELDSNVEPPTWLDSSESRPPPTEFFVAKNGLLHLSTQTIYPPTPAYFGVTASEVEFDPGAPPPEQWLNFLGQVLVDADAIACLQEWFGYLLAADTSQQKILFCIGPRRSGKGTMARLLAGLLGRNSVAGPTMSSLGTQFGLQHLITKSLAIISDARIGKKTDQSAVVERLLTISGEDTITVDRKFLDAWTGRLPTRIAIMTNELPSLTEGSGALAGRFIVLAFQQSFFGNEDTGLTDRLLGELGGILNWAIEGYQRLHERGHFLQPENAREEIEAIEMLGSPVKAFIRDRCDVAPGNRVAVDDCFDAWIHWCEEQGHRAPGTKEWFGRNLNSAVPGLRIIKPMIDGVQVRTYAAIGLRPSPPLDLNALRSIRR